jgi:hypothetical protein
MVLEALLQFANAAFDLFPWRLRNSWQLRDQPAWRARISRLHPLAPGERRNSFRIGEKRRYGGNDHYRVREQPCPGEQARAIATTLSGLEEVQLRGSIQA